MSILNKLNGAAALVAILLCLFKFIDGDMAMGARYFGWAIVNGILWKVNYETI